MQVPPDLDYDVIDVGLFEENPAPQSWIERARFWVNAFFWEVNDLWQFNRIATISLAVVAFAAGAFLF